MVFLRVSLFGVFFVLWARADSCQVKSVTAARSTPHLFTITRLGSIMAGLLARKQKFSQKNRGGPILPKSILRGGSNPTGIFLGPDPQILRESRRILTKFLDLGNLRVSRESPTGKL